MRSEAKVKGHCHKINITAEVDLCDEQTAVVTVSGTEPTRRGMPDCMAIIAVLTRGKLFLLFMAIGWLDSRFSVIRCFCTELNARGKTC